MLSDDDDATACISGSGDISSSSLVDSTGSGYDTSLSSSDESPFSGDERRSDDNENSQNDDPIMEEIAFLHAKTKILQRASHILLQHQDYQNLLSLQERSNSNTRSDAIWNEAKEFLRHGDDSGNENLANDSSGIPSSASENSLSAVNHSQTRPSNSQHRQRIGSQPHEAQTGSIRSLDSRGGGKIDTSTVQRITSQQYQNRLCLSSQVQPIRHDDWFNVNTTIMEHPRRSKKRNWSDIVNSSSLHDPIPVHPLSLPQDHFLARPNVASFGLRNDFCCKVEETATNVHQFSLLHRNPPLMTMAMEPYELAEDGQNSLSSASRQNNGSAVVGTVG